MRTVLRAAMMTLLATAAHADCGGAPIYSGPEFAAYVGALNTEPDAVTPTAYRATNQALTVELCLHNRQATPLRIEVAACRLPGCTRENIDIALRAEWYRDGNAHRTVSLLKGSGPVLIPELLLHDPDLFRNDPATRTTAIRTRTAGGVRHISSIEYEKIAAPDKNGRIKHPAAEMFVADAGQLMPIALADSTRLVIRDTGAGAIDRLQIAVTTPAGKRLLELPVKTYPYTLDEASAATAIYYRGQFDTGAPTLSSELKTAAQLRIEFADMRARGIRYPTVYIYGDHRDYMAIRNTFDFGRDKLFVIDSLLIDSVKRRDWSAYERRMRSLLAETSFKAYARVYFYLYDEPPKALYEQLIAQAAPIAARLGGYLFLAGHADKILGRVAPGAIYVTAYDTSPVLAQRVHAAGAQIYSYANPQIGVYAPEQLRLNYGFRLLASRYDGFMPYAYQHTSGSQWSDRDGEYREHMLTYPTSAGVLQTVHGLALENAIVDQRYATTYERLVADRACARDTELQHRIDTMGAADTDGMRARIARAIAACTPVQTPPEAPGNLRSADRK